MAWIPTARTARQQSRSTPAKLILVKARAIQRRLIPDLLVYQQAANAWLAKQGAYDAKVAANRKRLAEAGGPGVQVSDGGVCSPQFGTTRWTVEWVSDTTAAIRIGSMPMEVAVRVLEVLAEAERETQ